MTESADIGGGSRRVRNAGELGQSVRTHRRRQKLTQEDVALLVGSHRTRIVELERGKQTERLELVFRVLNELGLDVLVVPRNAHRGEAG